MTKKLVQTLIALAIVAAAGATEIRFSVRAITGTTNDALLEIAAEQLPFVGSNAVVVGYPLRLQTVGGSAVTNLVPATYRLTVVGPSPAQSFKFTVTNSASVLDVGDLRVK